VAHGGRWHAAFPGAAPARPTPRTAGRRNVELRELLSTTHPELGVLEAPVAYLWGEAGWLFAPSGDGVPEFTWYGADTGRMAFPRAWPSGPRLSGSILALASDFSNVNFAHFLLDGLSRLGIFEQSGVSREAIDHVYLPRLAASHSARFIEALGLRGKNVVWARPNTYVHADRVFVTAFPGSRRDCATWLPEFWQRRVPLSQDPPFRRLYVTRGDGTRRVANEPAIFRQLQVHGFEFIDPASERDPAYTFSQARVVVGAHGAGLANILFCRPGTRVLELIPTDHVYPHYYTLAAAGGLDHSYLAGESLGRRPKGSWGPSPFDFHIDEEELARALKLLLAD
jgi:capsular polysaccharide biosynthesis protein